MIRMLLIALLLYIGYRILVSFTAAKKPLQPSTGTRDQSVETFCDPICGMYISEEHAVVGTHGGKRLYFCSMNCLEKYREQLDHTSPT